jgi:hypothetical protein
VTEKRKRIMYLRNEEGKPTGVLVAVEKDSRYADDSTVSDYARSPVLRFGMVRYHPTKERLPFTKKKAREIAFDRAEKCSYRLPIHVGNYSDFTTSRVHTIPKELERYVRHFMAEAMRRLGVPRFENLYDPQVGHTVNA